jgi:hypothetical protein
MPTKRKAATPPTLLSEHIITAWRVPRAPIRWRYWAIALASLSLLISFIEWSGASALEPERKAANEVTQ